MKTIRETTVKFDDSLIDIGKKYSKVSKHRLRRSMKKNANDTKIRNFTHNTERQEI